MEKLKVAIVIPTHFDLNSSLNNLLKVYRCLMQSQKVEVTIFTDKKNNIKYGGFRIEKIDGIDYGTPIEKILFVMGIPRFYYTDLISKLEGYDVIESSNPEFYGFAYQSYKAAEKYNARLVYRTSQTVEGFYLFRITKYFVVPIARKAYSYASSLLFTNPEAEQRCLDLGLVKDRKKCVVIGHATDTKTFRPLTLRKKGSRTVLLSVGGLYKIKGHHLIIQALKKLIGNGFDAELWIVGGGYYKKRLESLSKKLGISDKVKFLGKKSHEELARIYSMSDIFVLANCQEITPAVNEAMACQKPIVAMKAGGSGFVIPNSSCGLITKKFDIDDMAQKIMFLIKNGKAAEKMARNGRNHILKNFAVEKVAAKIYRSFTS